LRERLFVSRHRIWQIATDAVLASAALYLSYLLRFNFRILDVYTHQFLWIWAFVVGAELLCFIVLGLYNKWWRYSGVRDLVSVFLAATFGGAVGMVAGGFAARGLQSAVYGRWDNDITARSVPLSVIILNWFLLFLFMGGARLVSRMYWERPWRHELSRDRKKVLVVGAGDAGELVVREMLRSQQIRYRPVGFVDDDPKKKNLRIHNVRVVGPTRYLPQLIDEYSVEEVIIAIPSVGGRVIQRIVLSCKKANVPVKTLPGVYELIKGSVTIEQLRDVQVEDVLGRPEVSVDYNSLGGYLEDRVVLVTGAGGSIGSELCRQIAAMGPRLLLMVDHSETALWAIHHELETERGVADLLPLLIDMKDKRKVRELFATHQPEVVFHAAAYKHVAMMEANPTEAFDNNTFATMTVVEQAVRFGVDRLVFISTDKAVEPTTVMGLSKAVSERIVETLARSADDSKLMCVRFGNVLGSSGSVVPIFKRQIAAGGPVTVTHEDMTRFFMTIPEAVRLVLQAGALGQGGEILVLDMGDPVRIVDLAREMIRLSGLEPDRDIQIVYSGVRPGEKLHEALFNRGEEVVGTEHPKIARAVRRPLPRGFLKQQLTKVRDALLAGELEEALRVAHAIALVEAERVEEAASPAEAVAASLEAAAEAAASSDAAEAGLIDATLSAGEGESGAGAAGVDSDGPAPAAPAPSG
jgi:FlaA1/EpsC-like NDP-sugar epimerase